MSPYVGVICRHPASLSGCPLYPLKADIAVTLRHVSFRPQADSGPVSVNYLRSCREQRLWRDKVEHLAVLGLMGARPASRAASLGKTNS